MRISNLLNRIFIAGLFACMLFGFWGCSGIVDQNDATTGAIKLQMLETQDLNLQVGHNQAGTMILAQWDEIDSLAYRPIVNINGQIDTFPPTLNDYFSETVDSLSPSDSIIVTIEVFADTFVLPILPSSNPTILMEESKEIDFELYGGIASVAIVYPTTDSQELCNEKCIHIRLVSKAEHEGKPVFCNLDKELFNKPNTFYHRDNFCDCINKHCGDTTKLNNCLKSERKHWLGADWICKDYDKSANSMDESD